MGVLRMPYLPMSGNLGGGNVADACILPGQRAGGKRGDNREFPVALRGAQKMLALTATPLYSVSLRGIEP